jgi:hypothetical protein
MADVQNLILPAGIMAVIAYSVIMMLYRMYMNKETFNGNKVLQTLGIGTIATITLYLATGAIPSLDAVLAQADVLSKNLVGNESIFVILGTLAYGIFEKFLKGQFGIIPTPIVTVIPPTYGTPAFPAGKGTFLGFYLGSAFSNPPLPAQTVDVNNMSTLYADVVAEVTGKMAVCFMVDKTVLANSFGWGDEKGIYTVTLKEIGQKIALPFWIPNSLRKEGVHTITIKKGYLEGASNALGGQSSNVVWDGEQTFTLTFTGVLKTGD